MEEVRHPFPLRMKVERAGEKDQIFAVLDILTVASLCLERLGLVRDVRHLISELVFKEMNLVRCKNEGLPLLGGCDGSFRTNSRLDDEIFPDSVEGKGEIVSFCGQRCQWTYLADYLQCRCRRQVFFGKDRKWTNSFRCQSCLHKNEIAAEPPEKRIKAGS